MSLPVMQFPILSPEQAMPGLTAAGKINQTLGQILQNQQEGIRNQYLPEALQQENLKSILSNQMLQPQAKYAPQMTLAELQQKQAMAPFYQAQTRELLSGKIPYEQSEAAKNYAGIPYTQAETAKTLADINKLKQMQDIISNAYYGNQTPGTLRSALGDTSTNQGPIAGTVSGVPVTSAQANVLSRYGQQMQPIDNRISKQPSNFNQYQTQPGFSDQQQRLMRLADVQAAMEGKQLPSLQPEFKRREQQNEIELKGKNDLLNKYSSEALQSQEAETNLNEWEKAYNATPTKYKGPWTPEWFSKQDPNAQIALKSGANLIVGELRPFFGGMGQLRVAEMQMLAQGTPNLNLSPEAAKEIVSQVRTALRIKQAKNSMAQKLSQFVDNPSLLESTIASAMALHNPVDNHGNINMSKMKDWIDYANPDFVDAVRNGRPESYYTQKDIEYTAKQNNMTVDQVKKRLGVQ